MPATIRAPIGLPGGLALSVASAALLFAAGEPIGWGPLAWVALVPAFVAVLGAGRPRDAALYGFAFGLAYFGVHLVWIFLFGWMAWTALTIVMSLYIAAGTFVAACVRRMPIAPVFVAGAWTGAELLRDRWPFGGYSWGSVGTTQGVVPGVRWLAGVIGVYGISFLIAFLAALVARFLVERDLDWRSVCAVAGVLAAFVAADLALYGRPPEGDRLRVAVVQGNVPRPARPGQRDAIFASHMRITDRLLARGPVDVVLWPEDALGMGVSSDAFGRVQQRSIETKTPFIIGQSVVGDPGTRFVNLVRHVDADGRLRGSYQKRHPVPFGEYVPIDFFRRFVGTLQSEVPLDLERGTRANVFDVEGTIIATPICFESVFPRDFLDFSRNGAELFVISTNNASFERSYASQQHIAHARLRALETRQWVVQAALAGISGVIAPDGTLSHTTKLFTADGFVTDVATRPSSSLYAKTGDLFPSLFAAATAIALLVGLAIRRRLTEDESRGAEHPAEILSR